MSALAPITIAAALALGAADTPAEGSSPADRAEARRLKNEAFAKIAEGSYADGVDLLEAAYQAVPHPTFLFNIAVVYDQWPGHCSESLETFDRFFEACDGCKVRATAEKRFTRVKDRCEVELAVTSIPTGSRVVIDDELDGMTPFEAKLRPGRHGLRVEKDGFQAHEEDVLLEPGRDQSLAVRLVPEATEPPSDLTAAAPPPARGANALRTWAWVAMGVGAVGAGVGVAYNVMWVSAEDEANELRGQEGTDPLEIAEAQDEARSQAVVAYVGYGVGAVGLGTGILLHVLAGQKAKPDRRVSFGTDGRGVILSGRF